MRCVRPDTQRVTDGFPKNTNLVFCAPYMTSTATNATKWTPCDYPVEPRPQRFFRKKGRCCRNKAHVPDVPAHPLASGNPNIISPVFGMFLSNPRVGFAKVPDIKDPTSRTIAGL